MFKNFELLNFRTSEPKANTGQVGLIKRVIAQVKVLKNKAVKQMKKSGSAESVASGSPLALCDGHLALCDWPLDGESNGFCEVEVLQEKLTAIQSLRMEIEAQT